jgi:hypothetical protein
MGEVEGHALLPFCECECGASHDRRGTGESGFSWHARHLASLTAEPLRGAESQAAEGDGA